MMSSSASAPASPNPIRRPPMTRRNPRLRRNPQALRPDPQAFTSPISSLRSTIHHMHSYTVSLRIESPILDTAEVTKGLGLKPTQTRAVGQRRSPEGVWQKALWEFEVLPEGGVHWESLEAAFSKLIGTFSSHKPLLQEYRGKHDVYLWVGHFSSSFDGGPRLSADILKALGDFGIPLYLATYFSDDER